MSKDQAMFVDGFEPAVIGLDTSGEVFRVVYDKDLMAAVLQAQNNMTDEEVWEYLEYNVFNAYVGKGTPLYIHQGHYERVLELLSNF